MFGITYERQDRVADDDQRVVWLRKLTVGSWDFNVYYRGEDDEYPHDHPWDFWVFPLQDFLEEVHVPRRRERELRVVKAWRWHFRRATHVHRIVGATKSENGNVLYDRAGRFVTITKRERKYRDWGYWLGDEWVHNQKLPRDPQAQS